MDGLYPVSSLLSIEEMSGKLNTETVTAAYYTVVKGDTLGRIAGKNNMTLSELKEMNPEAEELIHIGDQFLVQRPQSYLQVQVVKTIRYSEDIAFDIEKQADDSKYTTYEKVLTKGKKGSQDVVAEVVYVNGAEESRTILSTTVTQEPVTQVMVVGTKKQLASSGNEVVPGRRRLYRQLCLAAAGVHQCSSEIPQRPQGLGYFQRSGSRPQPEGGVRGRRQVVEASRGYNGGYGNVVVIEHTSGLRTVYAHLNSIDVVVGQKVSRRPNHRPGGQHRKELRSPSPFRGEKERREGESHRLPDPGPIDKL